MKSLNTEQLLQTINFLIEDAELMTQLGKEKEYKRADMLKQQIEDRLKNISQDILNITEILRRYNRLDELMIAQHLNNYFGGDDNQ